MNFGEDTPLYFALQLVMLLSFPGIDVNKGGIWFLLGLACTKTCFTDPVAIASVHYDERLFEEIWKLSCTT
jgi:hypothetical protein